MRDPKKDPQPGDRLAHPHGPIRHVTRRVTMGCWANGVEFTVGAKTYKRRIGHWHSWAARAEVLEVAGAQPDLLARIAASDADPRPTTVDDLVTWSDR